VRPATSATSPAAQGAGAGSGLGLTIVRRVVEAHGGRVFARNAGGGGGGAEVGFDLPAEAPGRR
jgi:signal transduction histidine kinase